MWLLNFNSSHGFETPRRKFWDSDFQVGCLEFEFWTSSFASRSLKLDRFFKIDVWNSNCIVDFRSLIFDEMSLLMFGFKIFSRRLLCEVYVSSLFFFGIVCSEDWMTMGETEGEGVEINLSCQEPLTCLSVGSCHEYSLQPLENRRAFVDNPSLLLCACVTQRKKIGNALWIICFLPTGNLLGRKEIKAIPLDKVWAIESPLKEKHSIPGFWWLVICCDPKTKN